MEPTENDNKAAGAPSELNAGLGKDLERELRAMINPLYEDVRGTESYERKRLLGEIDRLRRIAVMVHDEILKGENDGVLLELLSMAWRVPNAELTGAAHNEKEPKP